MKITRKLIHKTANDYSGFKRTLPPKTVSYILQCLTPIANNLTFERFEEIIKREVRKVCTGFV